MKLGLLLLFISTQIFAQATFDMDAVVVKRNHKYKAKMMVETLTNLITPNCFDGVNFKIVLDKSDDAICLDNLPEGAPANTIVRAATAYYHLNIARDFYINKLDSDYVRNLPKIVVRIDIPNEFFIDGHWSDLKSEFKYNNADTVPAGVDFGNPDHSWDIEIWYRPSKKIHLKEIEADIRSIDVQNFDEILKTFRNQTHMGSLQRFMGQLFTNNLFNGGVSFGSIFRLVGSSALMEVGYHTMDEINRLFMRKWYSLDASMIPEVNYHEFSHVALNDHLPVGHNFAFNEGIADFFAANIANSPKIAKKIKKYNTFLGRDGNNKKEYNVQFETTDYANTDFIFGMFWHLRSILGKDEALKFVYKLRTILKPDAKIRTKLLKGMLDVCEEMYPGDFAKRSDLMMLFNKKGL